MMTALQRERLNQWPVIQSRAIKRRVQHQRSVVKWNPRSRSASGSARLLPKTQETAPLGGRLRIRFRVVRFQNLCATPQLRNPLHLLHGLAARARSVTRRLRLYATSVGPPAQTRACGVAPAALAGTQGNNVPLATPRDLGRVATPVVQALHQLQLPQSPTFFTYLQIPSLHLAVRALVHLVLCALGRHFWPVSTSSHPRNPPINVIN